MNKTEHLLDLLVDIVIATHSYEDLSRFTKRLQEIRDLS